MVSFAIFPHISVPSLEILALDTIEEGPAAFIPILPLISLHSGPRKLTRRHTKLKGSSVHWSFHQLLPPNLTLVVVGDVGTGFSLRNDRANAEKHLPSLFRRSNPVAELIATPEPETVAAIVLRR